MKKLVFLSAGLIAAASANATIFEFDFTAKIDRMAEYFPKTFSIAEVKSSDLTGTKLSVGDVVSGHVVYDTNTGLVSNIDGVGKYSSSKAKNAVTMSIAGKDVALSKATTSGNVVVFDNVGGVDAFILTTDASNKTASETFGISLVDPSGRVLSNDSLPKNLNYSAFSQPWFYLTYNALATRGQLGINGALTSLTLTSPISAVPEPETYAMLLLGLGLAGWAARRRPAR